MASSIHVILFGRLMEVKLEQPWNAHFPMLSTLSGTETVFIFEHSAKAEAPILNTPSGIMIDVKLEHPQNACVSIRVRLSGRVTEDRDSHL